MALLNTSFLRRSVAPSALAAALSLSACAPDLGALAPLEAPQALQTARTFAAQQGHWPTERWWRAYGDPQLDRLEDEALQGSPDLDIAEARLRQAQAASQQAGAALVPDLDLNAFSEPTKQSLNQGIPKQIQAYLPHDWRTNTQIAGSLNYELDLYGQNRAAYAAAVSEQEAAAVDVEEARLVLTTSVAGAYADLVRLAADKAAAEDAVQIREQSAKLFARRQEQGLENRGAVAQAQADADAARADEDAIDGQIAAVRNEIAALVGKGPDRGLDVPLPTARDLRPLSLPPRVAADLIGRRPDLVVARLNAEAAADRIKVAHAEFYPNIDLIGLIGFQSLDASKIFAHSSMIGAVGPALHLPMFDGGRIEGDYRGARASYDEAVAVYDKTLVNALHEVADAMARERELHNELGHARDAVIQIEAAYKTADDRYRGGLARYLDVLSAQDTLVLERRRVADLYASQLEQDVVLVRALGGGFHSPEGEGSHD